MRRLDVADARGDRFMLFELIKNAAFGTVERHGVEEAQKHPIRVTIVHGPQDLTVRVSDEGKFEATSTTNTNTGLQREGYRPGVDFPRPRILLRATTSIHPRLSSPHSHPSVSISSPSPICAACTSITRLKTRTLSLAQTGYPTRASWHSEGYPSSLVRSKNSCSNRRRRTERARRRFERRPT
jgi:hypothetical protein